MGEEEYETDGVDETGGRWMTKRDKENEKVEKKVKRRLEAVSGKETEVDNGGQEKET